MILNIARHARRIGALGLAATVFALSSLSVAAAHDNDWAFIPLDPADTGLDVLTDGDTRVFADRQIPFWTVMATAHSESVAAQGFERCIDASSTRLTAAFATLPPRYEAPRDQRLLVDALKQGSSWLEGYGLRSEELNRIQSVPSTVYMPEYGAYETSWISENLVFCDTPSPGRQAAPTLFNVALDAYESSLSPGWDDTKYIKVRPERWNGVHKDRFAAHFQAGFALLRQHDHWLNPTSPNTKRQPHDWAGTMGLLPAIAFMETEEHVPLSRGSYSDAGQRYAYMPMDFTVPFTEYSSIRHRASEADETKFSTTAFWWFLLEDQIGSRLDRGAVTRLMKSRHVTKQIVPAIDTFIRHHTGRRTSSIKYLMPQFAAAYANWPKTRFAGSVGEEKWMEESFGGCRKVVLDETAPFEIQDFVAPQDTSFCIDLVSRAVRQDYTGTLHVSIGGKLEVVDNVFVAGSSDSTGRKCGEGRLSNILENQCLQSVAQHRDDRTLFRSFSLEKREVKRDSPFETRLIVSHVPGGDVGRNAIGGFGIPDSEPTLKIRFSLEVASLDSPFDVATGWSTTFAAKQGEAGIGPFGDSEGASAQDAIFNRGLGTDWSIIQRAGDDSSLTLGMTNPDGDTFTLRPQNPDVLKNRMTGTFDADASMTLNDTSIEARSDAPPAATITITEHSKDMLRFSATANICLIRVEETERRRKEFGRETLRIGMIDDLETRDREGRALAERFAMEDPCSGAFQTGTVEVSGSVPDPDSWRADGLLKTFETENYVEMRNIRSDRIRSVFGLGGSPLDGTGNGASGPGSDTGGNPSSPGASSPGSLPAVCPIPVYTEAEGCNCQCEAKTCLSEKRDAGTAQPDELSCRLFCGKTWQACP
ncbi:MAG: hypothetical protein AAF311_04115 [Pseudomonadota bacterium]